MSNIIHNTFIESQNNDVPLTDETKDIFNDIAIKASFELDVDEMTIDIQQHRGWWEISSTSLPKVGLIILDNDETRIFSYDSECETMLTREWLLDHIMHKNFEDKK